MMVNALSGFGVGGGFDLAVTLSASTNNYNVKNAAIAAGWDQLSPLSIVLTINAGVVIGSTSVSTAAFDSGTSLPEGSKLTITNNGTIKGKGGAGTSCRWVSASSGYWASNGGPEPGGTAIRTTIPTLIDNTSGVVAGGGGGGGFIGGYAAGGATSGGAAGGGGAGSVVGGAATLTHEVYGHLASSAAGTATAGGVGSVYDSINGPSGGALGAAGQEGTYYTFGGGSVATAGGAAGACLEGKAYVNGGAGITGTTYGAQA